MARVLAFPPTVGFALLLLASCVPVTTQPLNAPPRALRARPPASVELFETTVPARPYVEVAVVESRRRGRAARPELVLDQLRSRAGDLGCDGLVIVGAGDRAPWGYRGTCIVWKDAAADASAAPPRDPRCDPPCAEGFRCWGGVCAAASPAAAQ